MPLPRAKTIRATPNRPQTASQSGLEQKLESVEGAWSGNGELLNLSGWRALKYKESDHDLIVFAELTTEPESACRCNATVSEWQKWGQTKATCFYDLPIRCKRTRIYCKLQRFRCTACGKTTQQSPPGLDAQHQMTSRLSQFIKKESFNLTKTFSVLADEIGVSIQLIRNMFTARAEQLEKVRRIETPEWLAIDEVYIRKKMRCVITDPVRRQLIDILPSNKQDVLGRWLLQLPNRRSVKVVTIDMYDPYLMAITRLLPQAVCIVDRYHVHNSLNCAIKSVLQLMRNGMSYSEQRERMRDPHLLLKSRFHLLDKPEVNDRGKLLMSQRHVVDQWLNEVPEIGLAYQLKEDFSDILQMNDRQRAEEQVDLWLQRVREFVKILRSQYLENVAGKSEIPFGNVLTSIQRWRTQILNYIDYQKRFGIKPTNAFAEATNRQIKRAQTLGNGYTFEVLRAKVVHGGIGVKRRPMFSLVEKSQERRGRCSRRTLPSGEMNPEANVVRLTEVRESRDETKGLIPNPKDNEAWVERFENLTQGDMCLGTDEPNVLLDPIKRYSHGKKKRAARRRGLLKSSEQDDEQLKMF